MEWNRILPSPAELPRTPVVKRIEKLLGVQALTPSYDTKIAGVLGGSLFARTPVKKEAKMVTR